MYFLKMDDFGVPKRTKAVPRDQKSPKIDIYGNFSKVFAKKL